jgi:hypothetical protein
MEVTFNHNTFNGKWNGYYGDDWVTTLPSGKKHRFVFTFNSGVSSDLTLHFVVTTVLDWNNDNSKKIIDETIASGATSFQCDVETEYGGVFLINTGTNGAKLEVVSVTREEIAASVIPSGINTVWESSQEVSNNWAGGETFTIPTSKFSELEKDDYIFIYASPASNVEFIGFRNDWSSATLEDYNYANGATSGGTATLGTMLSNETYWWVKMTDNTILNIFKNGTPRVQGCSKGEENKYTITKVEIRKHVNIGEGANTISKSTGMIVNLDRSFVADTWNTVCLPFVPTADQANTLFGSGYKLAEFTGVSGTTMQFTTITIGSFEAGKPYLVMPKTGCATGTTVLFDVNITAKDPTPVTWGDYTFTGTFTTKKFTSADNTTSRFVATGNELVTPNENSTLKSLRCYFTVPVATARSLTFDIDEEGGTTSINTVQGSGVMVNGYYNLAGQRVAQPTKGLYIVNGKKVVIK